MTSHFKNSLKIISLLSLDIAAFYCSLHVAYYTRALLDIWYPRLVPLQLSLLYFLGIWWLPLIFLSFIAYERLYIKKLPFWDETRELLKAISVSTIAVLSIVTLGKIYGNISRLTIFFLWCYGLFLFPLFRLIGKRILFTIGLWKDDVIIVGAGAAGIETARGLKADKHLGYHVIGFLDDDENIGKQLLIDGAVYRIFGKIRHYRKFVKHLDISTVIIAIPSLSMEKTSKLTNEIQKYTKSVLLIPDIKGVALTNTELYHLFVQQLFLLKINNNLKSPYNRLIKRTFDMTLSLMFMPLFLPLIVILGLLIKLGSPGPNHFPPYQSRSRGQDVPHIQIQKYVS